jgi:hypothetical protein
MCVRILIKALNQFNCNGDFAQEMLLGHACLPWRGSLRYALNFALFALQKTVPAQFSECPRIIS